MATQFQVTSTLAGYAHQRFEGVAPVEMPPDEIARRCNDAADWFGFRDFKRDGERFAVVVHID